MAMMDSKTDPNEVAKQAAESHLLTGPLGEPVREAFAQRQKEDEQRTRAKTEDAAVEAEAELTQPSLTQDSKNTLIEDREIIGGSMSENAGQSRGLDELRAISEARDEVRDGQSESEISEREADENEPRAEAGPDQKAAVEEAATEGGQEEQPNPGSETGKANSGESAASSSEVLPHLNPESKPRIDFDSLLAELDGMADTPVTQDVKAQVEALKKMSTGEAPEDPKVIEDVIEFLDDLEASAREEAGKNPDTTTKSEVKESASEDLARLAEVADKPYQREAFARLAKLLDGTTSKEDYDPEQLQKDMEALGVFMVEEQSASQAGPAGMGTEASARPYYDFDRLILARSAMRAQEQLKEELGIGEAPNRAGDDARLLADVADKPYQREAFARLAKLLDGTAEDYSPEQIQKDLDALGIFMVEERSAASSQPEGIETGTAERPYYDFAHPLLLSMAERLQGQIIEAQNPSYHGEWTIEQIAEWKEDLTRWQERMGGQAEVGPTTEPESEPNSEPQPTPETQPNPENPDQETNEILINDVSPFLRAMAWRIAENKLNEITTRQTEAEGFWGRVKRFFRGSSAKQGEKDYLDKLFEEAYEELSESQNLRRTIEARLLGRSEGYDLGSLSDSYGILNCVIEQMEQDVLEMEERGEVLEDAGSHFTELFQRHLSGEFGSREDFEAAAFETITDLIERGVFTAEMFNADGTRTSEAEGKMFASNLWELAEANKNRVVSKYEASGDWEEMSEAERQQVLDFAADMGRLDIRFGLKLEDVEEGRAQRPDQRNSYLGLGDRFADFTKSHPILGVLINPTTLGFGVSGASSMLVRGGLVAGAGAVGFATGMWLPVIAGGVAGGVFAAIRRSRNLKYDRGMKQRREALGQVGLVGTSGEIRRGVEIHERGFVDFAENAQELLQSIQGDDLEAAHEAAYRALALLSTQRAMRQEGRPVDLIFVDREESDRTGTNLESITALKIALKEYEANNAIDYDDVAARQAEYVDRVLSQDENFESYRRVQAAWAGATGFITGVVAGIVGQHIADSFSEFIHGEANNKITLRESLMGERPRMAQEGYHVLYDGNVRRVVPEGAIETRGVQVGDRKFDVAYELVGKGREAKWLPKVDLPEGYSMVESENGPQIVFDRPGVEGGTSAGEWLETRTALADLFGLSTERASWLGHATNGTSPVGNSFEAGFNPRSNGSELGMDFITRKDGSVVISIARAMGGSAKGDLMNGAEHSVKITPESMQDFIATISPHSRVNTGGQWDAITLSFDQTGHSQPIPAEMAKHLIEGQDVKNGMMVTVNQVLGHDHGKTRLFEVMADYGRGNGKIPVPPVHEVVDLPTLNVDYVPPIEATTASAPWAIPFDRRRPIGNPPKRENSSEDSAEDEALAESEVAEERAAFGRELNQLVAISQDGELSNYFAGFLASNPTKEEYSRMARELHVIQVAYLKDTRLPQEKVPELVERTRLLGEQATSEASQESRATIPESAETIASTVEPTSPAEARERAVRESQKTEAPKTETETVTPIASTESVPEVTSAEVDRAEREPLEFDFLTRLDAEDRENLYRAFEYIRGMEGGLEEKRAELESYLAKGYRPLDLGVRKSIMNMALGDGREYSVNRMNADQFNRYLAAIMRQIVKMRS